MCGINGITKNDSALVTQMNAQTTHRGPDGTAVWESDGITFGHNRLAIIDLSENGKQPMSDHTGRYTITFNGEIYNYRELKEELKSQYPFRTESDTEVLLASYALWGKEMFARLRGIFAFGIWDRDTKTLTLARDHMGVKPLYYKIENDVLSFSSELTPLLVESPILDTKSVAFYLSMEYVPSPRSLIAGIEKLPPGHMLTWKDKARTLTSFLDPYREKEDVSHERIYRTVDEAVRRQLVSDRPVGAYLSGGFDSSIVVHHMTKHTPHTRTYSVNFEAVAGQEDATLKFNADAALAEKTAAYFKTDHKTFTIRIDDIRNGLESMLGGVSEPIANSTSLTQYLLSDFVRKDGTVVVLGGDAGDELFGGYTRHRVLMAAYLYQCLPNFIQKLGGTLSPRVAKLSRAFGAPLHRSVMVKDEKKISPFLRTPLPIDSLTTNFWRAVYGKETGGEIHPLDTFMRVDRKTWLPDECFLRSDYASMANGVELRVPLADIDVVSLSDSISVWKKTLPHQGKRIIRAAYKNYLPPHLYHEPKRGWLSPAAKWFRDPVIYEYAKSVFSNSYYSGLSPLFNWESIQRLLADHVEHRGYYLYPLWNILALQVWAREHGVVYRG